MATLRCSEKLLNIYRTICCHITNTFSAVVNYNLFLDLLVTKQCPRYDVNAASLVIISRRFQRSLCVSVKGSSRAIFLNVPPLEVLNSSFKPEEAYRTMTRNVKYYIRRQEISNISVAINKMYHRIHNLELIYVKFFVIPSEIFSFIGIYNLRCDCVNEWVTAVNRLFRESRIDVWRILVIRISDRWK